MTALSKKRPGARSWRRKAEGQAQVEFVLTILFLLLFIFGIIELIMMVYTYSVLADSAKEGVRYAIVHGTGNTTCSGPGAGSLKCTDTTGANVQAAVTTYAKLSFHDPAAMTVTVNYPDASSAAPSRVQVQVSYPYQPFFGLGWPTVTVRAAAQGRIAY